MITISDQLSLTLGLPLDSKQSNLILNGNNVKVETINEYLTRVDLDSRYLGLEVNIISPSGEYDINFFITNSQNNSFTVSKYKFEQNITNQGFVISSTSSSGGHIIKDETQSFTTRPNLTFKGFKVEDSELENSTNVILNIDSELSLESDNPLKNKVITERINLLNTNINLNSEDILLINQSINLINQNIDLLDQNLNQEIQDRVNSYTTLNNSINAINQNINTINLNITGIEEEIELIKLDIININQSINSINQDIILINQNISTINQNISKLDKDTQKLSTGWVSGMLLSINSLDNSKFDISSGVFIITDYTNPLSPTVTKVEYPGVTGITPYFLTTNNSTYLAIDINNTIVQSQNQFNYSQRRQYCLIGSVIHSNRTIINTVNQIKNPIISGVSQLHDLMWFVGPINKGNVFISNGNNLLLNKTSGSIFKMGVNPDINNPNTLILSELTGLMFRYRLRTGLEYIDRNTINPTQWDDNGVLSTVPNNKFTIQTIALFQSNLVRIQYGQKIYDNLSSAQVGLSTDPFIFEENIEENAVLRCYLIIKKEVTDLTLALSNGSAMFVTVGKFGEIIGSGSGSFTGSSETTISQIISWDGSLYTIPLNESYIYKRSVNNGVTSLSFSLLFPEDSSTKSRQISVIVDNSANTTAISVITFLGGVWNWDVGVQPFGLAAGAIATLELYNESNTSVKPNWTVKA